MTELIPNEDRTRARIIVIQIMVDLLESVPCPTIIFLSPPAGCRILRVLGRYVQFASQINGNCHIWALNTVSGSLEDHRQYSIALLQF